MCFTLFELTRLSWFSILVNTFNCTVCFMICISYPSLFVLLFIIALISVLFQSNLMLLTSNIAPYFVNVYFSCPYHCFSFSYVLVYFHPVPLFIVVFDYGVFGMCNFLFHKQTLNAILAIFLRLYFFYLCLVI